MSGRKSARAAWASRRVSPLVEGLERREVMSSGGLSKSLGSYVVPSDNGPKITHAAAVVNPHTSIDNLLATILGPGTTQVQAGSSSLGKVPQAVLKQTVLNQPSVHSILSDGDVYTLFNSTALTTLLGSEQVSGVTSTNASTTSSTTSTTSTTSTSSTTGTATTTVDPLVAFSIPSEATIQSIDAGADGQAVIQVLPSGGVPGFFATVPESDVRIASEGPPITGSVLIPQSSIPTGFPTPAASTLSIGTFSATYAATGPILLQIFNAEVQQVSPNAPDSVPGLRLAPYLLHHNPFPTQSAQKALTQVLRLAVQRNVFTLDSAQTSAVSAGVAQFAAGVQSMITAGSFTPSVPLKPAALPSKSLSGTLELSIGAVRRLFDVAPSISGLNLPSLGNFEGRLDVGYVVDRSGNYGIMLTLRGPLENANPKPSPVDVASGDVNIEVSNARNINDLNGQRVEEGVQVGSGTASNLGVASYGNGITTFSASAGNGFGLEYGTGVGYSVVIPLGNVYALIPSAPAN
jgi:hypothetical protein